MATEPITVHVDAEAARAFNAASPEERRKFEVMLSLQLLDAAKQRVPLRELMETLSRRAEERGMTPERLQEILDERDD